MNGVLRGFTGALVTALALSGGEVAGQESQNWYPFLGCWSPDSGAGPALCVRPTLDGIEMARVAEGQIVSREAFSVGSPARSEQEGCVGEHRASFSDDGQRVFLTSDYACEGGGTRRESGILSLLDAGSLLDVRSVEVTGEPVAWSQSYRAAPASLGQEAGLADLPLPGMALETSRRTAARSIDADDVVEALDRVGAGAVEAWVAETGDRFDLDAGTLVALSDRGVPESVLDLMIVVSYPDRFALTVDDGPSGNYGMVIPGATRASFGCSGYGYRYADPFFYDPFYSGCGYGYRYSRYNYGPYGYATGWYGSYSPPVVFIPGNGSSDSGSRGRVVNGRGYTRGGSSGGSTGGTSTGSASVGSGSSGGSSGGSSSPPARRAKPRGGGGGGLF